MTTREPSQSALPIVFLTADLEALAADLPAEFPGAGLLQDGELLAYLLVLRRLLDGAGVRPRGVIHVGASVGEELGAYLVLGFARMLMIEANPAAIPALRRNVAAINAVAARFDERMGLAPPAYAQAIHCAAGAEDGVVELAVMEVPTLSSLLPPQSAALNAEETPWFAVVDRPRVPMRRLDDLAGELANGWRAQDFNVMRLNIQGAELLALRGAARWLEHIELVFTEVNLVERYGGCPRLEDLDAFMAGHGFVRKWGYRWDPTGGDAVYVRG